MTTQYDYFNDKLASYRNTKSKVVRHKDDEVAESASLMTSCSDKIFTIFRSPFKNLTSECESLNESQINNDSSIRKRDIPYIEEVLESKEEVFRKEQSSVFESWTKIDFYIFLLKVLLWLVIWKVFLLIEFGAVYFLCSCFVIIWRSLHSSTTKRKGLSAYSVFNPNCEEIFGTYNASKVEKEFLFR